MLKKPAFFGVLAQAVAGVLLCVGSMQGVQSSAAHEGAHQPSPTPSASPSLPVPREFSEGTSDDDKKGTIGLVCTDPLGRTHFADSDHADQDAFRRCLEEVVSSWNVRTTPRLGFDRRSVDDKGTIGNVRGFQDLQNTIQRARGSVFPPLNR